MNRIDKTIEKKYVKKLNQLFKELDHFTFPNSYHRFLRFIIFEEEFRNKIISLDFEQININLSWLILQSRKENNSRNFLVFNLVKDNIKQENYILKETNLVRIYLKQLNRYSKFVDRIC